MNQIIKQLNDLMPGQSMVYYTSIHAPIARGNFDDIEARNHAYIMYSQDLVDLVQRRISGGGSYNQKETSVFEYIAIRKRHDPDPKKVVNRQFYATCLRDKMSAVHGGYISSIKG